MKKIIQINLKTIALVAMTTILVAKATAQPGPGGPGINGSGILGNGDAAASGAPAVPFDGGMSLMLAASGIGYVAKRMKRKK